MMNRSNRTTRTQKPVYSPPGQDPALTPRVPDDVKVVRPPLAQAPIPRETWTHLASLIWCYLGKTPLGWSSRPKAREELERWRSAVTLTLLANTVTRTKATKKIWTRMAGTTTNNSIWSPRSFSPWLRASFTSLGGRVIDELRVDFKKWPSEHEDIAQIIFPNHVNIDNEIGNTPAKLYPHNDDVSDKVFVTILDNGQPCELAFHDYFESGDWMHLIRDTTRDLREVSFGCGNFKRKMCSST